MGDPERLSPSILRASPLILDPDGQPVPHELAYPAEPAGPLYEFSIWEFDLLGKPAFLHLCQPARRRKLRDEA